MATYVKFQDFIEQLGKGVHLLHAGGHTLKAYLSNATPSVSADTIKSELAEISAEHDYPAGGEDVQNDWSETTGTGTLTGVDITITANGGTVGPFRYVVLYNDTPTSPLDPLVCYWDYGSAITLQDGESFTINFGASIFTMA